MASEKRCVICGDIIPPTRGPAKYCKACSQVRGKIYNRERNRKYNGDVKKPWLVPNEDDCYYTEDEAYINLAGAVIGLALHDYIRVKRSHDKHPANQKYRNQMKYFKRWFDCSDFAILCCGIDPRIILKRIENWKQ